ncbi:MAG: hypothetical protein V7603_1130 [Micromonosporaceae bacterium]
MTEPSQDQPSQDQQPQDQQPQDEQPSQNQQRSGLRNPAAAVRGLGAAALVMEAIVLLLAIVPLIKLAGHLTGVAIGAILTLVVACLVLAGLVRHRWAWYAGLGLQGLLALCGVFNLALLVLGILFGAVWIYVLSVRRTILGR